MGSLVQDLKLQDLDSSFVDNLAQELGNLLLALKQTSPLLAETVDSLIREYQLSATGIALPEITKELAKNITKNAGNLKRYPLPALIFASVPENSGSKKFNHLKGLIVLLSFILLRRAEEKNENTNSSIQNATRSIRLIMGNERRWLFDGLPERFTDFAHLKLTLENLKKEVSKNDQKYSQVLSLLTLVGYVVKNKNIPIKSKYETVTVPGNSAYEDHDVSYEVLESVPKQVPKGMDSEEFKFDQTSGSKLVQVKVDVGSANSSLTARQYAAAGFTNAMIMREMNAPCLPNSYQTEEVKDFVGRLWQDAICETEFKFEALTCLLMVFTSSTYEGVVQMLSHKRAQSSKIIRAQNGRIGVRFSIQLPQNKKFKNSHLLVTSTDNIFWLPLPDELASIVCKMCNQGLGPEKENIYRYLDQLPRVNVRNFTLYAISLLFFETARHRTQDLLLTALVCGWQPKHYAPIYYYWCNKGSLEKFYLDHISWLLTHSERVPTLEVFDQAGAFGTKISVHEAKCFEVISKLGKGLQRKCKQREYEPLEYHNEFVVYTYLILCLSTGHRPVSSPFEYLSDFDLEDGIVWISDKAVKSGQSSRTVSLPVTALKQVRAYITHLKQLSLTLKVNHNNEHIKIDSALTNHWDFLTWYDGKEFVALTPSLLEQNFKKSLKLPPNWQRHFLATALRNMEGISEDQVNAVLGHSLYGDEPFGCWSGFSSADLRKIASAIDILFSENEDIKIVPISIEDRLESFGPGTSLLSDKKHKATGVKARAANRSYEIQYVKEDVGQWFWDKFEGFFDPTCKFVDFLDRSESFKVLRDPPQELEYSQILSEILQKLDEKYPRNELRQAGKHQLSRLTSNLNTVCQWNLDVFVPPLRLTRPTLSRTRTWFHVATEIKKLASKFIHNFDDKNFSAENFEQEEVLGCVLISAALNGGLCIENALLELSDILIRTKKPLQSFDVSLGELPSAFAPASTWVDLYYSDDKVCSVYQGDEAKRYMRWFIDPITLALIYQFLPKRNVVREQVYETRELSMFVRHALKKLGVSAKKDLTINTLCRGGIAVLESKPGIDISNALLEVCASRQASVCISPVDWLNIFKKPSDEIFELKMSLFGSIESQSKSEKNSRSAKSFRSDEYGSILSALKIVTKTGLQRKNNDAVKELLALDDAGWSSTGRLLRQWIISKLSGGRAKFKISSARRYLSEIGSPLILYERDVGLVESQADEFLDMSEDDLLAFYNAIISQNPTTKSRQTRARILSQFHRFCETHYGLPPLSFEFEVTEVRVVMVRPGYVSRLVYQRCITILNEQSWTKQQKQSLILFFILAYRFGLRLGEVIKLRLCDIDNTKKFWIYVRTNRYGDNKTDAAYRKIPAYALLPKSERKLFHQYLNDRKKNAVSDKELLFCNNSNGTIPLDNLSVSRLLTHLLKSVSGNQNIVFHNLRHTALSNLQIILEKERALATFLTGYSEIQQEEIFECICGNLNQKLRIYWYLAAFAGHRSPETTFQHYLHFSNLLVRIKLDRSTETLSRRQVINMLGISPRTFSSNFKGKLDNHRLPVSDMWEYAKGRLRIHTTINELDLSWIGSEIDIIELNFGLSPTADNVNNILKKAWETKKDIKDGLSNLSLEFCAPEQEIQAYIDNVRFLNILKTRNKNVRLFTNFNDNECLVQGFPLKPKGREILINVNKSIDTLTSILWQQDEESEELEWWLEYYFRNVKISTSTILFSDLEKLKRFIKCLTPIIPLQRWLVETNLDGRRQYYPHKEMETWLKLELDVSKSQAQRVSYHLFLLYPDFEVRMAKWQSGDKQSRDYKKYCSSELRYILSMAWVMTNGFEAPNTSKGEDASATLPRHLS